MLSLRDELPNRSDKNYTAIETKQRLITLALSVFSLKARHKV
jgi:hypothetical protein